MEKIYDVFISYRRDSGQDIARALQLGLENKGLRVFFDLEEIRGGNFNEKLYIAIEQSKNVIFLLTEGACDRFENKNDWVRLELEHAVRKQINIVPVAPLGSPRSFPEKLPDSLEPLRSMNIAVLDKNDLFKQTVQEIILNYLHGIEIIDDAEKKEAEKVFLELARSYKNNDGIIDAEERADLELKAKEFKINAVRREAIIQQVEQEFQTTKGNSFLSLPGSAAELPQYDVFISYRRDGGSGYARLIYDKLEKTGYSVSFDRDTLKNGKFNEELLRRIAGCKNFIILLSKDCFQRTLDGVKREDDWLRIELSTAISLKKNIITVMLPGFNFPKHLPSDIDEVRNFNGPEFNDTYIDAFYDKLINEFLEGNTSTPSEMSQANQVLFENTLNLTENVSDEKIEELLGDDAEYCRMEAETAYHAISRVIPYAELRMIDDAWNEAEYNFKQGDHKIASHRYMDVLNLSSKLKPLSLPFITQMARDGIELHRNNWFEAALDKANAGDPDYQYGLGSLYSQGIGVEKNASSAFRWFDRAAKKNHVKSIAAVGAAYASGNGIEKNYSLAFQYLEKAFEQDDAFAAERLGFLYQHGFGLPQKDYRKAIQYYNKAAELGNSAAMAALGQMIENGQGGTPDLQQAISCYQASAQKADPTGQMKLAQFLFSGNGIPRNYSEALKLARASANQGNADAMALLGKAYEDGLGVPADKNKAKELYQHALGKGSSLAKEYLTELEAEVQYNNGMKCLESRLGMERNYEQALRWFEKAAAQGNSAAMEQMGYLSERGLGGKFDVQKAKSWYEKAAEKGNAAALADLGNLYFQGDFGIEKDYSKAMELLKKAVTLLSSAPEEDRWKVLNAFFCIGKMYEDGRGVSKNILLALRFYLTGAHYGNLRSAFQLGQIYQSGRPGIPPSAENSQRWFEFCASHENDIRSEDDRAMRIIGHLYKKGYGGKKQDAEIACIWYEKSAKMGNVLAITDMGRAYRTGDGVTQNISKALDYFMESASRGNASAQNSLSWTYYKGLGGISKDFQKAYEWGLKAAENGNAGAMETLFRLYRDGNGVEKNETEALKWLKMAVEKGSWEACASLGICYESGEMGVETDISRAILLYQKAAGVKNAHGLYELGRCYWFGIGVEKNIAQALKYLVSAVNEGDDDLHYDSRALGLLSEIYFSSKDFTALVGQFDKVNPEDNQTALFLLGNNFQHGTMGLEKNIQKSIECYFSAATLENPRAQANLGWLYYTGEKVRKDPVKAFEWTMRSVQNGNSSGMETLFRMYRDGTGVEQCDSEALKWLEKAAETSQHDKKNNSCPISELGECHEFGLLGLQPDPDEAFKYYHEAAKHNYSPGRYNLGRCFLLGIGTEKNLYKAIDWLQKASECEDFDDHIYQERAMRLLAEIYRTGEYAEVNEEKANEWLKKADEVKKQSESLKKGTK